MIARNLFSGVISRQSLSTSALAGMTTASNTPVEDTIRERLTAALSPSTLVIRNDSYLHAHHQAIRGTTSKETHFHVMIISAAFQSKSQPARHRMVYGLLKDEMSREGGIHALQLRTRTPDEWRQAQSQEAQQ